MIWKHNYYALFIGNAIVLINELVFVNNDTVTTLCHWLKARDSAAYVTWHVWKEQQNIAVSVARNVLVYFDLAPTIFFPKCEVRLQYCNLYNFYIQIWYKYIKSNVCDSVISVCKFSRKSDINILPVFLKYLLTIWNTDSLLAFLSDIKFGKYHLLKHENYLYRLVSVKRFSTLYSSK